MEWADEPLEQWDHPADREISLPPMVMPIALCIHLSLAAELLVMNFTCMEWCNAFKVPPIVKKGVR